MVAFYLFGTRRKNAAGVFAAGAGRWVGREATILLGSTKWLRCGL